MNENDINLNRTCDAMLIPAGTKVRIAKDTAVKITHKLGGNFTVSGPFGIARIEAKDADALGLEVPYDEIEKASDSSSNSETLDPSLPRDLPSNEELWELAKTVYDPEVPVNIVDLGLIYRLETFCDADSKNNVEIDMTLTSPGCVMGPVIAEDLRYRIEALPSVDIASVNIVWDPPWSKDLITEEGKMILGLI